MPVTVIPPTVLGITIALNVSSVIILITGGRVVGGAPMEDLLLTVVGGTVVGVIGTEQLGPV
jgi:hypothetical protein